MLNWLGCPEKVLTFIGITTTSAFFAWAKVWPGVPPEVAGFAALVGFLYCVLAGAAELTW